MFIIYYNILYISFSLVCLSRVSPGVSASTFGRSKSAIAQGFNVG